MKDKIKVCKVINRILCIFMSIILTISFVSYNKVFATSINASSYIVMEANSNRIIDGKNINERYLTASICKILTAIIVIENYDIDEYVLVTKETVNQVGSKVYLVENDLVSIRDLLYGLLLRSGNDCAYLLSITVGKSEKGFVRMMNDYAKMIGMTNSCFANPSGLDEESFNYSTAYDMALLMIYAMKNNTFRLINGTNKHFSTTAEGNNLYFYNKHKLITSYDYIIGGKTGYTKRANRTLVTYSSLNSMELVCVTFNSPDDWNNHIQLIKSTYNKYELKKVINKQIIKVKDEYEVTPYLPSDIYLPLKANEKVKISIYLLNNPEEKIIGKACVYVNNELITYKNVYRYY